jgi:hypothetical protein
MSPFNSGSGNFIFACEPSVGAVELTGAVGTRAGLVTVPAQEEMNNEKPISNKAKHAKRVIVIALSFKQCKQ